MTTVILAMTYADAAEAARKLGVGQDFIYPHTIELLHGVRLDRVVYVQGWLHSPSITTEVAEFVNTRVTPDTTVVVVPREGAPSSAPAGMLAPFVAPVYREGQLGTWRPPRRRLASWVLLLGYALAVGLAGGVLYRLGAVWGWWA